LAGRFDFEAGALEHRGDVGEQIAGRVDAQNCAVRGRGMPVARGWAMREGCQGLLLGGKNREDAE
jgi:hypothetical protein